MSSCCANVDDKDHPDNQPEKAEHWASEENSSITHKERGCTDILLMLMLLACWFAMTILGFTAFGWIKSENIKPGDPNRLIRATDYLGNICGVDDAVKDYDKAYYLYTGSVVCIKSCPSSVSDWCINSSCHSILCISTIVVSCL